MQEMDILGFWGGRSGVVKLGQRVNQNFITFIGGRIHRYSFVRSFPAFTRNIWDLQASPEETDRPNLPLRSSPTGRNTLPPSVLTK